MLYIAITRDLEAWMIFLSQELFHTNAIQFHRLETIHNAYGSIDSTFEGSVPSNLGGNSRYAKGTILQGNQFVELLCCHNLPWHHILSLITSSIHGESWKNSLGSHQMRLLLFIRYQELETSLRNDRQWIGRIHGHRQIIAGTPSCNIWVHVSRKWGSHFMVLQETDLSNIIYSQIGICCSYLCS